MGVWEINYFWATFSVRLNQVNKNKNFKWDYFLLNIIEVKFARELDKANIHPRRILRRAVFSLGVPFEFLSLFKGVGSSKIILFDWSKVLPPALPDFSR